MTEHTPEYFERQPVIFISDRTCSGICNELIFEESIPVRYRKLAGKVVRIISIHNKVDSRGDLFPETKAADVLEIFGALLEECDALQKASAHIIQLKQNINQPSKENNISKAEREKTIVAMYNNWHSIDDIWNVSGFSSRNSVLRILNKYGVALNRGKFSGPLGKRNQKE